MLSPAETALFVFSVEVVPAYKTACAMLRVMIFQRLGMRGFSSVPVPRTAGR